MEEKYEGKTNSIKVFLLAFLIFSLSVIPSLIFTKGVWIYYGDFNVQQIPFYAHAHDAIRNGNFFYDFSTDLGGSLIGCYSFYLLASPFFWLTIPFPSQFVPYLMPWLSALKYALMALFAYQYIKKHVKTDTFAMVGALLYAFSGFSGAVLVYNHFHDVLAFFPLYLILFERMIEKRKVLAFSLMTAFMATLNYYFFVGIAVFLVIYYVSMYACEGRNLKKIANDLLTAFFSGLSGVLISLIYLLPAVYYTLGNGRLSKTLVGYDLVSYKESTMLLNIIKNTVMLSDISGLNSMLNQSGSRVSGIGAYLPLFSIAG
ncbi:MAG: YfhO family protein, partial [Lachnospiraceae bacterium]|nr:YfhO family protein [Lachnospiraceae bacterium]